MAERRRREDTAGPGVDEGVVGGAVVGGETVTVVSLVKGTILISMAERRRVVCVAGRPKSHWTYLDVSRRREGGKQPDLAYQRPARAYLHHGGGGG